MDRNEKIAGDILTLARNTLLVKLRFLDLALNQLKHYPDKLVLFGTDGKELHYDPKYVISSYINGQERPLHDYLHMLLHCILQHMYAAPSIDPRLWDLSCDIAVEAIIYEMNILSGTTERDVQIKKAFAETRSNSKEMTAEKIYRYLSDQNMDDVGLSYLERIFRHDVHDLWRKTSTIIEVVVGGDSSSQYNLWRNISGRMQMELLGFSKNYSSGSGDLIQNLREVNREKYDYTEFLKKFAVMGEVMKLNDEEFDYVYYSYGLSLYKNMPLIEPLEYKETKRIREFAIAIDTSGSVNGEQVQSFINKTYNIMLNTESFFSKINLHIIQCDAEIKEHKKITCKEEFEEYIRNMKIRGFGGTDFRPVFDEVDKMIKAREFTNLKGLIYFTDGYGVFPMKKPGYKCAFVFVSDDDRIPTIPVWAVKLVLRPEDL